MTGSVLWFFLVATGVIGGAVCLGYALWQFLALALRDAAAAAFGPRTPGAVDPRLFAAPGGEPARPAYWARQMWWDSRAAVNEAALTVRYLLARHWLSTVIRDRLLRGRHGGTDELAGSAFGRLFFRLLVPGYTVAAVLSAVLSAVLLLGVALVFAVQLVLVALVALAGVLAGRTADALWRLTRGIRMTCPYPDCYRPFPLAVHVCPDCRAAHRELRPGRFGALRHVCRCGRGLPTTALTGRRKLATRCPYCDQSLPAAIGTTRVVHLPLVGGTSAGKTMLMAAMLDGLRSWSYESALTVEYATPADRHESHTRLDASGWALKTQGGQPRALMLLIGHGRRRRLLFLYDPMGESLRDADVVRRQGYLAHADGVVLVADVLASPVVRRSLRAGDHQLAAAARPADLGPVETYSGVTGELQGLGGRRARLPVATVVTKRDVLDRLTSLPPPTPPVEAWLRAIGLDDLVSSLGHDFAADRYWAVSARAATGAGALPSEQRRAAEPVLWLLSRTGLRVGALVPRDGGGGSG
ncbi:hypothetical protein ACFWBH_25190 [Streptomyces sp. NPDC059999]|uniref:TRAFAC clade GTPase domain-containing protein n=1 Tax=Streptomyces sp. NPDC059999 TaxID=3347030 RepID=UPI0036ADC932